MTAVQLALREPTRDPEPDDGDQGPWCRWPRDLWGQHATDDQLDHITDVPTGEYL